jgi:hypothetical protein
VSQKRVKSFERIAAFIISERLRVRERGFLSVIVLDANQQALTAIGALDLLPESFGKVTPQ